jgi:hypothetical protein
MPAAFTADEISKPLVFKRVIQNTSYILNTPEGRVMATAQALGADVSSLFGKKPITEQIATEAAQYENLPPDDDGNAPPAASTGETSETIPDFDDEPSEKTTRAAVREETPEQVAFKTATAELLDLIQTHAGKLDVTTPSGKNPFKIAKAELESDSGTIESRKTMTAKMEVYLEKLGVKA